MTLRHQDFVKFNTAVAEMYRMAHKQGTLHAVAHTLPQLMGGDVGTAGISHRRGASFLMTSPEVERALLRYPIQIFMTHPRMERTDLKGSVVKISDLLSRKAWHRKEIYQISRDSHALEEDMGTDIVLADGRQISMCVMRKRRTFLERDRDLFTLLLPHVKALLEWECPRCDTTALQGMGLTRREQEVLLWVSEGKTNAEVGQILEITAGTVKIHLERIYKKLGVENRHGATLRALRALGTGFDGMSTVN